MLGETEFPKSVSAAYTLKRKLGAATSEEQSTEVGEEEANAQIEALKQQNVVLNERLQEMNKVGFAFRGQIVQQINQQIAANNQEIARIQQAEKKSTKSAEVSHKDETSARQAYLKQVLEARTLADRLIAEYSELNHDREVAAAIKEWNEAAHTSHKLAPSHSFDSALKRLEALELKIVSGKVPLREKERSYFATVTINGVKPCEMLVDANVTTLCLPHQVAVDAGLHVDAAPETTTVVLADGSKVEAKHVNAQVGPCGEFRGEKRLLRNPSGCQYDGPGHARPEFPEPFQIRNQRRDFRAFPHACRRRGGWQAQEEEIDDETRSQKVVENRAIRRADGIKREPQKRHPCIRWRLSRTSGRFRIRMARRKKRPDWCGGGWECQRQLRDFDSGL